MTEPHPASPPPRSNNSFLYFVVGALVVGVCVLSFIYVQDRNEPNTAIERTADAVGDAADDIADSVRDASRNLPPPRAPEPSPPSNPVIPPG